MQIVSSYQVVALFSGGLDSILAAKVMQAQGLSVLCLHYCTPFFGNPEKIAEWQTLYGLTIMPVDVAQAFVAMLVKRPRHGFGSVLNPCVDCKILMLRHAKTVMQRVGASCIVSGEVLGQRPMSQRRAALNMIANEAGVDDILLRPLSAKHMAPIAAERQGLVSREAPLAMFGRGRKQQLALAKHFGIQKIPTPAGGCRLAEQENARSYWPLLNHLPNPCANDFYITAKGRQFWSSGQPRLWLTIGRNQQDNADLAALAAPTDLLFKVAGFGGPVALGRVATGEWGTQAVLCTAALVASYVTKAAEHALRTGEQIQVRVHTGSLESPATLVGVAPSRTTVSGFAEYDWHQAKEGVRGEARAAAALNN